MRSFERWGEDMKLPEKEDIIKSYYRQRRILGYLGLIFAVLLALGAANPNVILEPSISHFFHTLLRDVFAGVLFAIGTFLIAYEGYTPDEKEWISDRTLATIAGIGAIGIAIFPNQHSGAVSGTIIRELMGVGPAAVIHYTSAIMFSVALTVFCFAKFSRTSNLRNRRIFKRCGYVMIFGCVISIGASTIKGLEIEPFAGFINEWSVVFWGEAITIWAFAFSWLIKGKFERHFNILKTAQPKA